MPWKTVAQGRSLDELAATVKDFELTKGTKIRFELDLNMPVSFLFDVAGIEHLFSIEGVDITDVYGEGWSRGVIEAEADPAWLAAIVAWVGAHWVAIAIGGILLYTVVSFLRMLVDVLPPPALVKWAVIGMGLYLGYQILRQRGAQRVGQGAPWRGEA